MVKIIATYKSERTSCDNCGSQLEYFPVDVKKEGRRDRWGEAYIYKYITCPVCGEQTRVCESEG